MSKAKDSKRRPEDWEHFLVRVPVYKFYDVSYDANQQTEDEAVHWATQVAAGSLEEGDLISEVDESRLKHVVVRTGEPEIWKRY